MDGLGRAGGLYRYGIDGVVVDGLGRTGGLYRYCIDGVVVDGLGRAGGLDRGEQGPLSFNYDL